MARIEAAQAALASTYKPTSNEAVSADASRCRVGEARTRRGM
jgi:hypothetical protein